MLALRIAVFAGSISVLACSSSGGSDDRGFDPSLDTGGRSGPSNATDSSRDPSTASGDGSGSGSRGDVASGADGLDAGSGVDGSVDPSGPASAPRCSSKPGASGTSARDVMVGGTSRHFLVHIPESADANAALPIVFVHHGFTMSGQIMLDLTSFRAVADREGFVAVFPDGSGATPWNVGQNICGAGAAVAGSADDFGFVEAMLDAIEADQCIDRAHVYTAGFSMGGYFSNHIGCQRSDLIRAIAPHSGGTYMGDCPDGPIPVMLLHGTSDPLISYSCGTGARDEWVARNGCSRDVEVKMVKGGKCEWHKGCPPHGQVVLCSFDGMGHGWAGATGSGYAGGDQYEDAAELIWKFFAQNR